MAGLADSNLTTTTNDEAVTVIADGQTGSGIRARVSTIANVNRLAVDAIVTTNSKLRYLDMNVANGGVARGTSVTNAAWVDVFNYSGSGLFFSFRLTLQDSTHWEIRLLVDGEEIFGSAGITTNDIVGDALYDMDTSGKSMDELFYGPGLFLGSHDQITFSGPNLYPIRYATSVNLKVKRAAGQAARAFRAGLMVISQAT